MQSISNAASAAKNYVYGDNTTQSEQSGTEPISGRQGEGYAEKPYDAGNTEGDASLGGQSAQEVNEVHAASNSHGPHPTYAGNMLDPKTGGAASEQVFGHGGAEPNVDPKATSTSSDYSSREYDSGAPDNLKTEYSSTANRSQLHQRDDSGYQTVGGEQVSRDTPVDVSTSEDRNSQSKGYGTEPSGLRNVSYNDSNNESSGYNRNNNDESSGFSGSGATQGRGSTGPTGTSGQGEPDLNTSHSSNTTSANPTTGSGLNQGGAIRPEHQTEGTGVLDTQANQDNPKFSDVRPTEANEDRPNYNAGGFGAAEPSVNADPGSGAAPRQKQQGGDRPTEEPEEHEAQAVNQKTKQAEKAQAGEKDTSTEEGNPDAPKLPNDHSGEPMHMHGGGGDEDKDEQERRESVHPGQEGGGEPGKEKGTGEQWVKSSGVAAEGGDFDATKPGAGKEAQRILEGKGIDHTPGTFNPDSEGAQSGAPAGKSSVGDKIKDKLHMGRS